MRLDPSSLDRQLLPEAAVRLRRVVDAARSLSSFLARPVVAATERAGTAAAGAVRSLDRRWASSGPLALVADVPAVGLLVVAAVLAGGLAAAAATAVPASSTVRSTTPGQAAVVQLGAQPGEDAAAHLSGARAELEQQAARSPGARLVALVELAQYLPVTAATALGEGTQVERVYLKAPSVSGGGVVEVPLTTTTTPTVLPALCTSTAARESATAAQLQKLADAITGTTPALLQQRRTYLDAAERSSAQSGAFGGECRTLFALVVDAPAAQLLALQSATGVRGVEPARPGVAVDELQVHPLLPEVTGRVPADGGR